MGEPTTGQLALLCVAIAVFVGGGAAALLRRRIEGRDPQSARLESLRVWAQSALFAGSALTLAVLVWHCWARNIWLPLEDNFGAFLCLAILLALFVIYTQRVRPLRGLDLFIMPVVLLLQILAAVFGKTLPHEYREKTWSVVHVLSTFTGFLAFAIAGALGGMYLIANRRLRSKKMLPGQGFGSLERLEHLTRLSVTLGFSLLTIGLITGFILQKAGANAGGVMWYRNTKVLLTCVAWVVYALVLHAPINPSFRGRRTATLSVVGLVLMIGVLVAVQFV
ncbi:MAG TPA: cytochrome c biogenesis protein CcsA [Tepidisphaeraceae bacterium]|jgi:ABC-type uncharacterized transport system permease subunit|nr:cytochrome c biogenesis protein CcsA [Tepidisphaeraceae bacterium]